LGIDGAAAELPPTGYRRATTLSLAPRRDPVPGFRREDLNTLPAPARLCAGGRVRSCNCGTASQLGIANAKRHARRQFPS